MDDRSDHCLDDQQLVDLALGETTGRERGDALGHVLGCPRCRAELGELIETSERLLLAAPQSEPPPGFESAVVAQLTGPPLPGARRRRGRRALLVAAAVLLVLTSGSFGWWLATDDGGSIEAAPMTTPAGRVVGRAWVQDDEPSWILLSVPGWAAWDTQGGEPTYTLEVLLDDGSTTRFDGITLRADGSWSTTTELDAATISELAIVDRTGRTWCRAEFS